MKIPVLILITAVLAFAQTPPSMYEISGKVIEPGLGPIIGASVTIMGAASVGASTDAQGAFHITISKPGNYPVMAGRAGYLTSPQFVTLTPDRPKAELNLEMLRPGRVSGRVVDDQTREPLKDFEVYLVDRRSPAVSPDPNPRTAKTDSDGRFHFEGIAPGEFLATTRPLAQQRLWALEVFKPEDADLIESGYEETYWPGGASIDLALPVALASGGFAEVGTIIARKATLYRALLHLRGECTGSIEFNFYSQRSKQAGHAYPISCGSDLLMIGLSPGSYIVHAFPEAATPAKPSRPIDGRSSAIVPIEIKDKNLEVDINLRAHVILDGQWMPKEGMKIPAPLPLVTNFEVVPGVWVRGDAVERTDDTRFRLSVPPESQVIEIRYLPGYPYPSEIRFNGAPIKNSILNVTGSAAAQRLEVILDNRPASLSGEITDGSKAIPGAIVSLVPESYRGEYPIGFGIGKRSAADQNGHFELAPLIPGDYRILAVPASAKEKLTDPAVLADLLPSAQKITLEPNGSKAVTVRATNAR